jgi:selenocysteine lyase/cysteine desulfurase
LSDLGLNPLSQHYKLFKVSERLLLTGHSHQAWPDVAFDGVKESFLDAALYVDEKWDRAFEKAERVKQGFAHVMEDLSGDYALASSTHDLLIRLLSAVDLRCGSRIVVTDGEFHSAYRQLTSLQEAGVDVVWVPVEPLATLAERMLAHVNSETRLVMTSAVFFTSGKIFPGIISESNKNSKEGNLQKLAQELHSRNVPLVIDVYHALNAVPFVMKGLENAFVVGGGYKYMQLGEGNCFLRSPKGCALKPVVTGWMADFGSLSKPRGSKIEFDKGRLFEGSTYDPVSNYRASKVFDFFKEQGLTPKRLREISQKQKQIILDRAIGWKSKGIEAVCADNNQTGGFVSLKTSRAGELNKTLMQKGVLTDCRGEFLRLGPAPYLADSQINKALDILESIS